MRGPPWPACRRSSRRSASVGKPPQGQQDGQGQADPDERLTAAFRVLEVEPREAGPDDHRRRRHAAQSRAPSRQGTAESPTAARGQQHVAQGERRAWGKTDEHHHHYRLQEAAPHESVVDCEAAGILVPGRRRAARPIARLASAKPMAAAPAKPASVAGKTRPDAKGPSSEHGRRVGRQQRKAAAEREHGDEHEEATLMVGAQPGAGIRDGGEQDQAAAGWQHRGKQRQRPQLTKVSHETAHGRTLQAGAMGVKRGPCASTRGFWADTNRMSGRGARYHPTSSGWAPRELLASPRRACYDRRVAVDPTRSLEATLQTLGGQRRPRAGGPPFSDSIARDRRMIAARRCPCAWTGAAAPEE